MESEYLYHLNSAPLRPRETMALHCTGKKEKKLHKSYLVKALIFLRWFHYLHIPLYTELNFHVRKSQSVAGTFLFGCSFKKRMKNLEGKINSWKTKFILTRKLKAYSHAKQLEKLGLSKSLWMTKNKVQLNEAAVKLKQRSAKEKTPHLSSSFLKQLGDKNLEQWFNPPSIQSCRTRCTCRAHILEPQVSRSPKEHREVPWKLTPQREEGIEEEISIS